MHILISWQVALSAKSGSGSQNMYPAALNRGAKRGLQISTPYQFHIHRTRRFSMKQLVVYSSQSGNTQKLAEEIFRQLPEEKEIAPVSEAPDPSAYDVVCIGFWLKGGQPDPASQAYLKKCGNCKLFLFASHGAARGSNPAKLGMNKAIELADGATILGTFSCQGEVPAKVLENAANKDPKPDWLDDAPSAKGHPNGNDFMDLSEALTKAGLKTEAPTIKGSVVDGSHAM